MSGSCRISFARRFASPVIASLSVLVFSSLAAPIRSWAADKAANDPEAAIRAGAKSFTEAFDHGDAKAIAAMWIEKGTLVNDQGESFKGRKAIEAAYAEFFKQQPGAKIEIAIQSIELPTPTMAVEDGVGRVIAKSGVHPVASRYTVVHVLEDGKWRMATVRETAIDLPSNYAALKDLEWLVGNWKLEADGTTVENKIHWIANKSFLQRDYTVREQGVTTSSGMQIIGWDPQAGRIRSWSFDSAGGHGGGLWSKVADGWQIKSSGVLPDGTPTTAVDHLIRVPDENDVFGWESTDRHVGEAELPDLKEAVLDRVPEKNR